MEIICLFEHNYIDCICIVYNETTKLDFSERALSDDYNVFEDHRVLSAIRRLKLCISFFRCIVINDVTNEIGILL